MRSDALSRVSTAALAALATELENDRLQPPFSAGPVSRHVSASETEPAAAGLTDLAALGLSPRQIGKVLRLVGQERLEAQRVRDRLELVWSGPEATGAGTRDTAIVVRDLFGCAEHSVLVATFAIYQGRRVFEPLTQRMAARPGLRVRLVLNVARPHLDASPDSALLAAYARTFREEQWPEGATLPEVFYDPRALATDREQRASLHAKCVVVDDRWSFVTSANFTEAAQDRNIEAGVLIDDPSLARNLRAQFDSLIASADLKPLRFTFP